MANTENQHLNTNLNADKTTDVTRSQNREAAAASQEGKGPHMGTASEDTGSRPSNDNKDNKQPAASGQTQLNETGSHREGQYPHNNENNNMQDVSQAQAAQEDKKEARQESNQYTKEARRESEGLIGKPGDKPE